MKKTKKIIKKDTNTIACPSCGTEIDIAAILDAQVSESVEARLKAELTKQEKAFAAKETALREEIEEENDQRLAKLQDVLKKKFQAEQELKAKVLQQELAEKDQKIARFTEQEISLRKQKRELEEKQRETELELTRRLDEERQKLQNELTQKISEEHQQKELQLQKQLNDVTKQLSEAKRKAEQGSMQNQGEVFELALEEALAEAFVLDRISPVAKGVAGADIHQQVFDRLGRDCGLIVWESKQTKAWNKNWSGKLKDDLLGARGDIGVIVSTVLPEGVKGFGEVEGVWVSDFSSAIALSAVLRSVLIENTKVKLSVQGKNEKMEAMYAYLSGSQFRQRVETIVGSFRSMQEDLNKEKAAFTKIWAKREKQIQRVLDNTLGMHGDLQGLMGSNLPELPEVELLALAEE